MSEPQLFTIPEALREEYLFASQWRETGAGRQHYVDEGQGVPVVMVHGNPTWSFFYRRVIKRLRGEFRCIAPDHLGCGLSDKPQDWSYRLRDHQENLAALLRELELSSYHLIVHDWGGPIGLGMAMREFERVRSVTILNTAAFTDDHLTWRINAVRNRTFGEFLIRRANLFVEAAARLCSTRGLLPAARKGFRLPYGNVQDRVAVARFVQDIPLESDHPSYPELRALEEQLPRLKSTAMQVIWGGQDFCFDDHYYARWQAQFPAADFHYLPEAGHYLIEDEPEKVCRLIKNFLRRV